MVYRKLLCLLIHALLSTHHFFINKNYVIPITNNINQHIYIISSHMYKQRLMKEATEAAKRRFNDYLLIFNSSDMFSWEAYIEGPQGTPY